MEDLHQKDPTDGTTCAVVDQADSTLVNSAITSEVFATAKRNWEDTHWRTRFGVFEKAADKLKIDPEDPEDPEAKLNCWRTRLVAAIMCGQGKSVEQAESDVAAVRLPFPDGRDADLNFSLQLCDFLRFGAYYAQDIYLTQSPTSFGNVTSYAPVACSVYVRVNVDFRKTVQNKMAL